MFAADDFNLRLIDTCGFVTEQWDRFLSGNGVQEVPPRTIELPYEMILARLWPLTDGRQFQSHQLLVAAGALLVPTA